MVLSVECLRVDSTNQASRPGLKPSVVWRKRARSSEDCLDDGSDSSPSSNCSADSVLTEIDINRFTSSPTSVKRPRISCITPVHLPRSTAPQLGAVAQSSHHDSSKDACLAQPDYKPLQKSIEFEKHKEVTLRPDSDYVHSVEDAECANRVTPVIRTLTVSWLGEAAAELKLSQEALYLCISMLDRFLSKAQGCPHNLLQLVAIAALSLAAKVEEVQPPTLEEMSELSAVVFKVEDIVRMELVLLDELEWQTRMPTSYSFLRLYGQLLPEVSSRSIALASYFTELGLLHHEGLQFTGSVTAVSALVLSDVVLNGGHTVSKILGRSEMLSEDLLACIMFLSELHLRAAMVSEDDDITRPLFLVREKYLCQRWCYASDPFTAAPLAQQQLSLDVPQLLSKLQGTGQP